MDAARKALQKVKEGMATTTPGTKTLVEEMALAVCERHCASACDVCKRRASATGQVMLERMREFEAHSGDGYFHRLFREGDLHAFAREHGLGDEEDGG